MIATEPDAVSWVRIVLAFAIVGALLGGLGFILRHINARGIKLPIGKNREKRLELVESLGLDLRRRLVVVRWDGREHLLLLGASQDIVVAAADSVPQSSPNDA
jgi:flagellar protein FliO/FliZ